MLNDPDEEEVTEDEEKMRRRHIQERLRRARSRETITAMIERYKEYGVTL